MNDRGYSQTVSTAGMNETPKLVLEQPTGDVTVEAWDRPEIMVSVDDKEGYFELEQNGSTVLVHNRPGRFNLVKFLEPAQEELREFGIEVDRVAARIERQMERQVRRAGRRVNVDLGLGAFRGGRDYYVMVPHDCDLNLRTSSGDIRVMGVRGNLFVQTTNGDVRLRDLAGNLIVNSASGDLVVDGFHGKLGLRTASGDIKTHRLTLNEVNASSASGDVSIDLASAPSSSFELKTVSGELTLHLPADARFRADIHTVSGSIKTGFGREQVDYRSNHKRETVLDVNGGGVTVYLHTVSGDVYIRPRKSDDGEPRHEYGWRETSQSPFTGRPQQEGAMTMDLSRNPEYARVHIPPTPPTPSPERRAAELEILQKVQSGEYSPQEAVQRLAALDSEAAPPPVEQSAAPETEAEAPAEESAEQTTAPESEESSDES